MNPIKTALAQLDAAAAAGKLSPSAVANIRTWLSQPYLADYAPQVAEHLAAEKWPELEDAFWTTIPFGTGGRRGRMYPIGCNAINDRTIGESAQGLADYVKTQAAADPQRDSASAAGVRHRLRHAPPLAPLRRAVQRDHGRGRLHGLLPRRLPQHARALVHRASQAVRLRDHDHGQPQPAVRQCREGLRPQRRAVRAAPRCRLDRRDASGHLDQADAVCRGDGRRQDHLLPGRGRRRVHQGRVGPKPARPAQPENPLFAAARRGRVGRRIPCSTRPASATWKSSARTPSPTATSPTCPTTSPTRKTPPSSTP